MEDGIRPNDRDVPAGPQSHRTLGKVSLTPCQRVGYAATLVGFLVFTLFTALFFGAVM